MMIRKYFYKLLRIPLKQNGMALLQVMIAVGIIMAFMGVGISLYINQTKVAKSQQKFAARDEIRNITTTYTNIPETLHKSVLDETCVSTMQTAQAAGSHLSDTFQSCLKQNHGVDPYPVGHDAKYPSDDGWFPIPLRSPFADGGGNDLITGTKASPVYYNELGQNCITVGAGCNQYFKVYSMYQFLATGINGEPSVRVKTRVEPVNNSTEDRISAKDYESINEMSLFRINKRGDATKVSLCVVGGVVIPGMIRVTIEGDTSSTNNEKDKCIPAVGAEVCGPKEFQTGIRADGSPICSGQKNECAVGFVLVGMEDTGSGVKPLCMESRCYNRVISGIARFGFVSPSTSSTAASGTECLFLRPDPTCETATTSKIKTNLLDTGELKCVAGSSNPAFTCPPFAKQTRTSACPTGSGVINEERAYNCPPYPGSWGPWVQVSQSCSNFTCTNGSPGPFPACPVSGSTPPYCVDTTWSPDPSTACSGTDFVQTSNCGRNRTATGTQACAPPAPCTIKPAGTVCRTAPMVSGDPYKTCDPGAPPFPCDAAHDGAMFRFCMDAPPCTGNDFTQCAPIFPTFNGTYCNQYVCDCSAPVVNGDCGSADGVATATAPVVNLCDAGTPTAVSGSGPWTWSCNGSGGGTNASCSAPLAACTFISWFYHCFPAGTQVELATGELKNIEDIQVGELVKTFDEEQQKMTVAPVKETFHHEAKKDLLYTITFEKGEPLVTNGPHYIYVPQLKNYFPMIEIYQKWLNGEVDYLMNSKKEAVKIIKIVTHEAEVPLYNLHVASPRDQKNKDSVYGHNFFANDILVHNEKAASSLATAWTNLQASGCLTAHPGVECMPVSSYPRRIVCDGCNTDRPPFEACITGGTPPVNGSCGTANGTAVSSAPSSNLCAEGNASTVSGTGPWTWTCDGLFGGTTASCSAPVAAPVCTGNLLAKTCCSGAPPVNATGAPAVCCGVDPTSTPTAPTWYTPPSGITPTAPLDPVYNYAPSYSGGYFCGCGNPPVWWLGPITGC